MVLFGGFARFVVKDGG